MQLVNETAMVAGYTMATDKTGRESVVVVVKGTFGIPVRPDKEPKLLAEQVPLVMCDEFTGEPGFSAPLYEIDYAPRKPRCDVLLNGSAYAPGGRPEKRVTVSLKMGTLAKSFDVVGNRVYKAGMLGVVVSEPELFTAMPISYNNAFGGVDRTNEDPSKHRWYLSNHAGVGFHDGSGKAVNNKPLPNTEETSRPVSSPAGPYKPMAFGPVGRAWQPRIKRAGTYDQQWIDAKFPFLPDDFDERYFQAAAEDQQTDHLTGGEAVELLNLTPQSRTTFHLPRQVGMSVLFFLRTGEVTETAAAIDTLLIEPDMKRLMLTWRANHPVRRTIREVTQIVVGCTRDEWDSAQDRASRRAGKQRYPSLRELVASSRHPGEA